MRREFAGKDELLRELAELRERRAAIDAELELDPPNWDSNVGWLPIQSGTLETFTLRAVNGALQSTNRHTVSVQVREKPFGRGTFRIAYYLKTSTGSRYVAKKMIINKGERDLQRFKEDVLTQKTAQLLANQFNSTNPPRKLEYVDAKILHFSGSDAKMLVG